MAREMKDSGIEWIGTIPIGWRLSQLKRFVVVGNGKEIEKEVEKSEAAIPVYGSGGIFKYTNNYLCDNTSVLFGRKGTLGKPLFVDGKFWTVDTMYFLTFSEDLNPKYCFYQLIAFDWQPFITQTALPSIVASDIISSFFPFPPLQEQYRIADFLDTECGKIDAVIEQTHASIEEYKKLKQAVITEAVTKGICPNRPMKDSGIEWIGKIPADWKIYRIANLYDERNENGQEDLSILTVSINTGISDHEIADEDQTRVFIRSEDKTKYKRVSPGDLAYNMMRAWQGAFGAVRVEGMVSPAYVVAKPKMNVLLDSRFMEALLRTPSAVEEMHRFSRGITDFRLRLYWPEFKNLKVCIPSLEEQKEIADYIDIKSAELEHLIDSKQQLLIELENYKKSLIYEYVTGKKEVPACP